MPDCLLYLFEESIPELLEKGGKSDVINAGTKIIQVLSEEELQIAVEFLRCPKFLFRSLKPALFFAVVVVVVTGLKDAAAAFTTLDRRFDHDVGSLLDQNVDGCNENVPSSIDDFQRLTFPVPTLDILHPVVEILLRKSLLIFQLFDGFLESRHHQKILDGIVVKQA